MIERDSNTIRAIAWSEVFPWLSIVRVFRLAIAARALLLGAAGILIMETGWGVIGYILGTDSPATDGSNRLLTVPGKRLPQKCPTNRAMSALGPFSRVWESGCRRNSSGWMPKEPMPVLMGLVEPPCLGRPVECPRLSVRDAATLLLCGLLGVAVWAFFGTAICRIAAVQLAADEQVGWGAALRYRLPEMARLLRRPAVAGRRRAAGRDSRVGAGVDHAGQRRAAVGRTAVAVGAGGRLVDGLAAVGPAVRLAVDVGHDQHRRDRQLRRPEPLLRLRVPAAAALPVLCARGRLYRLARLAAGAELRRGRGLDGLLGRRLGKRQRSDQSPSWAAAPTQRHWLRRRRVGPLLWPDA